MQEKIEKAKLHRVISTGTMEHRFEVLCKDRTGQAFCSCMKPKLLHLPCSHLIAACAESALQSGLFVSPYISKEAAVSTWGHEVYGIGIVGPFTQDNENKMFIPDPATKKGKGRRQTRVFGMVWTSRKQVRHKIVAANVEHWVTTT